MERVDIKKQVYALFAEEVGKSGVFDGRGG
jgi:hypothetical protein